MSDPVFSIPIPSDGYVGAPASDKIAQEARFYGEDIWYDVSHVDPTTNAPDYVVTASGDWAVARGLEALRQSLLRRLITNPGEWATVPEFGVGAQQFVKRPITPAVIAELEGRIRSQFMRDDRVESVQTVRVENLTDIEGIKITVFVVAAGRLRQDALLPVQISIT
jgi:phage baseplate assembly protein W